MSSDDTIRDSSELTRLRQAVAASGELVFMTGLDGVFTFVNQQFERTYGYAAAEVVGRATPRVLKGGLMPDSFYEEFWAQVRAGHTVHSEFVNRTKDGREITVEAAVNAVRDADGHIVGFLAIQRDITRRKRAEDALRQNEELLRLVTDNVSDMVSQVRLDGTYLYASRAHERVLGYAPRALLGTSAFALVHPDDLASVQAAITAAIRKRTSQRFEFRCRHADGHYVQLEAVGTLLMDDTGAPIGAVLSGRDITKRRQLEDEYRHAQKMEIVGRIAGGIAHDFNNVLTAVLGYSDLLIEQHAGDADLIADLVEIRTAGERASRLTRQLLTFSRKQDVQPEVLDLNALVGGIQSMVRRVIGEDVHTAMVFAPTSCPIKADPGQLEQVVMNLAVNARDAMPKGGRLTISTAHAELGRAFVGQHAGAALGPHVSLAVTDTGHGMSADVIAHVFEPFFTTKPVGKGTGLGLATVHQIAQDAGGCVTIDSTVGMGTTVTVYFPLIAEALTTIRGAGHDKAAPRGSETILLAEDDQVVRELMAKALARLGYVVLVAEDAARAQALEATHDGPIQLLLSDIVMPGMNGPDLAQRLVRRRPDLQVLYVSGFTSLGLRLGSISPHTAFLPKPFGPDRLAQMVRESLDRAQPPQARA